MEKPTLRSISTMTGFAVTTVSKALADDPLIADRTRTTIKDAAKTLGYVPDRAAQRLRTGRTNVVTLVLDPHSEILGFGISMITGITEVFRESPYHLTIMHNQLGDDPLGTVRYVVKHKLADGIMFARVQPQDPRIAFLLDQGFPFVSHGRSDLQELAIVSSPKMLSPSNTGWLNFGLVTV